MSCTAKLPIYAFFVDAFFEEYKALIMIGLYTFGILMAVLVALIYKKTLFRGEAVPFVMEMPNYRLPSARNVAQLLWEKSKDFLSRAFSVILIATVIVWFLKTFDFSFNIVTDSHDSILAVISGVLVPLFRPAGLGDWRIITSLVSGFMAKESVVSVLGVLFGGEGGVTAMMTPLTAASLLVFSLLYTPCVAAVASVKSEMGGRWAVYVVLWQCFIAWTAAVVVRVIGLMLGLA
jgi:ferrous iron transport protein B